MIQIPENPDNNDIRDGLIQLGREVNHLGEEINQMREELSQLNHKLKFEKPDYRPDYRFGIYQNGMDGMVKMATRVIITTAFVVVLSSYSPAAIAIIRVLSANAN